MRILYIVHQFLPEFAGGTERVTYNLARAAQADGHRVEVATISLRGPGPGPVRYMQGGLPVTAFRRQALYGPADLGYGRDEAFAAAFRQFLQAQGPFDAAHLMHGYRTLEAAEQLAERRIPYVTTLTDFFSVCHEINLMRRDGLSCEGPERGAACEAACMAEELKPGSAAGRFERLEAVLRNASFVVAVSAYVAERVRRAHPGLRLQVIENGIDLSAFPPPAEPASPRALTFGYLGTISEVKGAALLARAFARAAPVGSKLRMVGPAYDGELLSRLRAETAGADISWEGAVAAEKVCGALSGFDVLCVPSQVPEAFSLVLREGFAAGLPALVSDLGAQARAVRDAGCGRVVAPPGDIAAWAAAIGEIAASPGQLKAWRARAPLPWRVEEEAALYAQVYRGLASLRRASAPAGP